MRISCRNLVEYLKEAGLLEEYLKEAGLLQEYLKEEGLLEGMIMTRYEGFVPDHRT
jgi:hypothetical protein